MQLPTWTIYGDLASKSNGRRIVRRGRRHISIKSKKALSYSDEFQAQDLEPHVLEGDVAMMADIYYATRRPDLDESLLLDLLQGIAYENDRQVKWKLIRHRIDKEKPRQVVTVVPISTIPESLR